MKMWRIAIVMLTVVGSVALTQASSAQSSAPMPMMMQDCPMKVQGVEVATANTPTGIALTFTAKPEQVEDLRQRVQRWATMHTEKPEQSRGAMAPQGMMGTMGMMPGTAKYEAVPNGARLTLTPKDPAKLAEFRTTVRTHVEKMKKGDCAMMQQMMQGMMMQGMPGAQKPEEPAKKSDKEADHSEHHPEQK